MTTSRNSWFMPGEGGGQGARLLPRHCGIAAGRELAGGASITVIDGLVAATTLEHNLTIVTCNSRDFAYILRSLGGILKHEVAKPDSRTRDLFEINAL
jgi:hypothetical protein